MSDLFVCGSRGPKSVPVLHHFTLLPASPDLGAQGVPGMPAMPGMQGMSLVLEVFVVVGDAGDVAGKYSNCLGVFFGALFATARLVCRSQGDDTECLSTGAGLGCCLYVIQCRRVVQLSVCSDLGQAGKGQQGKARQTKGKQGQRKRK